MGRKVGCEPMTTAAVFRRAALGSRTACEQQTLLHPLVLEIPPPMSLDPELSLPEVRAQHHLPLKSYAQAADEALQPTPHTHEADDTLENGIATRSRGEIQPPNSNGVAGPTRRHVEDTEDTSHSNDDAQNHNGHVNGVSNNNSSHNHVHALTRIKSLQTTEQIRRIDSFKPRNSELKTGRQAGAGWSKSKIRFAPMNVPLQRRLQTLAVLMHTLSIVGCLALFFFLCSIPLLWPILLPYTIYVLFSNAGTSGELSLRSERFRRLKVWSLFASYFPARLHRSQELEPTRKYVFGYHPHGIISHGAFAAFATEALGFSQLFPGITNTLLTLDSNFRYPIYREYALRLGMASVSRESCENILSKGGSNGEGMGRAITIVVGGAAESLDARPGVIRLVLRRRKGFVKMAIRTGADLVPVLAFGENDIYDQLDTESHPYIHKFQLLVKKVMGFTIPIFHARGIFNYDVGMMPYRRPINIVVGRPIRVVQNDHPETDYLDKVHEQYIGELVRLWDEHKDTFAEHRMDELEIAE